MPGHMFVECILFWMGLVAVLKSSVLHTSGGVLFRCSKKFGVEVGFWRRHSDLFLKG